VVSSGIRIAVDERVYDAIDALEKRTQKFAVDVIDYCRRLPRIPGCGRIPDQLSGAATSVGSNHRAMRRARSKREFAAKLQTVVEESDESVYWLEVTTTASPETEGGDRLLSEAKELRAIFARARATNRERRYRPWHSLHSLMYSLTR
jgi:four helix bundle protein